jgi:hypothetical protein
VGSVGELVQHVAAVHNKVLCQHCGEVLNSRQALYYHMDKRHRRREQLKCAICNKMFTRIWTKKNHMQYVHGIAPNSPSKGAS